MQNRVGLFISPWGVITIVHKLDLLGLLPKFCLLNKGAEIKDVANH